MCEDYMIMGGLKRFERLHRQYMNPFLKEKNITYEQYFYMFKILTVPNCNQGFLADYFNTKESYVSSILRDLEDKNCIDRKFDPDNRRAYILNLSKEGIEVTKYLRSKDLIWEEKILQDSIHSKAEIKENFLHIYEVIKKEFL